MTQNQGRCISKCFFCVSFWTRRQDEEDFSRKFWYQERDDNVVKICTKLIPTHKIFEIYGNEMKGKKFNEQQIKKPC